MLSLNGSGRGIVIEGEGRDGVKVQKQLLSQRGRQARIGMRRKTVN